MFRSTRFLGLFSLFCLLLAGCGSSTVTSDPEKAVAILTFAPSALTVTAGAKSTLTWTTANATTVSISPNIGAVATNGSVDVTPAQTTIYTLTATGSGQTATGTVTVNVTPLPAPTVQFSASPASIQSGSPATLAWTTTNATTVTIDQGVGVVAASGSKAVSPTLTTTYTLTATGNGQTVTGAATVTVTAAPAPTVVFSASPTSVQSGTSTTLSWTTTNATTVSIDQGVGTVAASGTKAVSPTQTTTYTLTATGNGQTVTGTATVTVTPAPAPTVTFSASPTTIQSGSPTALTWSTTNATTVSIDQGVGTVALGGTTNVSPTQTTTYTLTATGNGQTATGTATVTVTPAAATGYTGILDWKGGNQGIGRYDQETILTPANVNTATFGKVREFTTDGDLLAQPLYVRNVNLGGTTGIHDLIIVATENDSVYGYDGKDNTAKTPLWQRNFLNAAAGITTQADNHGGRSTFGGQIGITGTPVVDPATGVVYVVTASQQSVAGAVVVTDTLHALDIKTGNDFAAPQVISATYPGTGEGQVNGQIPFAPAQQNQRPGLELDHGTLYVAFGSFSDNAPYHGWLFAYDPTTLTQLGVFNSSPTYRADYDFGSAAAFWNGGAAPSFETDGSFYIVAADGSTDVENGGEDYGDTVLHMKYSNGTFSVLDWFTPFNRDCIDRVDIEMGSGGFALLPTEVGNGHPLGVVMTKEGRFYLLDRLNLGHFDATADQSVQMFMVGDHECATDTPDSVADGPVWNRLYGDASYWNGNIYLAASNQPLKQYAIQAGVINTTPIAVGATITGLRGGNTVVSANGTTNAIVWAYEKQTVNQVAGNAILHAYDATNVSKELWNSSQNVARDGLVTGGEGFQVALVIDGKVITTSGHDVVVYQVLQ